MFSGLKPKLSAKNQENESERSTSLGNKFVSNYDARMLRKPPSSTTTSKHVKHNTLTKRPSKKAVDGRRTNVSMERNDLIKPLEVDNEAIKRYKVQEQILGHINTGKVIQDAIITPIVSNDGHIRQYIINDPISDPEEIETELALQPGSKITNTTVDRSKCSTRRNGVVKAYSANTNKGIIRNYNEDRVSIILNILKPSSRKGENWPKCSFFGVFDGHGGSA